MKYGVTYPKSIPEESGLGIKKTKKILGIIAQRHGFNSANELKFSLHQTEVKKLLAQGFIQKEDSSIIPLGSSDYFDLICSHVFPPHSFYKPKTYFQSMLFPGMTVEEIWNTYYRQNNRLT